MYDCYKTPNCETCFDFKSTWEDYRKEDGYSIFGGREFRSYVTDEAEDFILHKLGLDTVKDVYYDEADALAKYLTEKHGEEYVSHEIHGCCQGDWALFVTPEFFIEETPYIEQEYFNLCDEWFCVPESGPNDGMYCWTYPLINESDEEQLRNIVDDEVVLHYPRTVLVWD